LPHGCYSRSNKLRRATDQVDILNSPVFGDSHPQTHITLDVADSGARRTGFRGERENDSGVKVNRIPG